MNITILDGFTLNPGDLSWDTIKTLGNVSIYEITSKEERLERAKNAAILIVNKTILDKDLLDQLPNLKCICVSATGYNVVDTKAAAERNIPVCNVSGYSSPSVAQHVFALILSWTNQVQQHNDAVQNGAWQQSKHWSFWNNPIIELADKKMGILGYGQIGQAVGQIALGFGMQVLASRRSKEPIANSSIQLVDLDTLLTESDFLSLHTPLTPDTAHIINKKSLQKMKNTAFIINTGRGGLVHEQDLKAALEQGNIAGAALDVLSEEPPIHSNPLIGTKNTIITPHQAWGSIESRARLMRLLVENVRMFIAGTPINVVN